MAVPMGQKLSTIEAEYALHFPNVSGRAMLSGSQSSKRIGRWDHSS